MEQRQKNVKAIYRADRKNWLMDETSIELMETIIDEEKDFPYKYQVHLTYQMNDFDWLHDKSNHEKHLKDYLDEVANKNNSHLKTKCVKNQDWEKPHFHIIIMSEKPLQHNEVLRWWKKGSPKYQSFKQYTSQSLFKSVFPNAMDGGLVKYMYRHHKTAYTRETHCPCRSNTCRKGRCPHQT